jgi:hypothetical protein
MTQQEKKLNLEILAGKISRIIQEKIEIETTTFKDDEFYRFLLPDTYIYHTDLIEVFATILETVKNEDSGILFFVLNGKIIIHTTTL